MESQHEKAFKEYQNKAGEYVDDKEKTAKLLDEAMKKAKENKGPLDEVWEKLQLLFSLTQDWISGDYREIPVGSIVAIIGGLIYFISPIDLVPDFIPVLGYADDVAVLSIVIAQVSSDLDKYKQWKEAQ